MADLIIFIWFSVLLTLAHSQQEDSTIENITVDMKTKWLRWTNLKNVTEVHCTVNKLINGSPDFAYQIKATNNSACEIMGFHSWCQGVEYVIEGSAGKKFSKTFHFPQRGEKGTTEENLSCQIYDANIMDCKWTVRETPRDIKYQFFYSGTPDAFMDTECPKYKMDSEGRNVGCHFDNLSGFQFPGIYHFLVNGTSSGREVQCIDDNLKLTNFEILKPPNINIKCTLSNCSMKWQKPKTILNFEDIVYELCIQKDGKGTEGKEKNCLSPKDTNYDFKIDEGKYSVKIRAKKSGKNWSEWSEPQEFDHKDNTLTLMLSLLGVVFIMLLIMGYLCKRYHVIQKIFPPIPHIKDQVSDIFQKNVQEVWEGDKILPEQCEIEEIRVIQKNQTVHQTKQDI
ncbi:interleukin-3 receptor subunit alpha-like isoform X2 [Macrotis lagotis]|uniref:interleukin-3 receptor subunit alpha-like isoform X2 n=1 Tax=Macrotis lagotis TaxID=92651 RepID=UPI003D683294